MNNSKFIDKPMMADREITIIDALIKERNVEKVLEWGSGGSTIYFPNKHQSIRQWVSIEHNGHYISFLKGKVDKEKVVIFWANETEQWYVDSVKLQTPRYDMILIDGLHREKCIQLAPKLLNDKGFVLLHDAYRKEYSDSIQSINNGKRNFLCGGEVPVGNGFFAHRGLLKIEL